MQLHVLLCVMLPPPHPTLLITLITTININLIPSSPSLPQHEISYFCIAFFPHNIFSINVCGVGLLPGWLHSVGSTICYLSSCKSRFVVPILSPTLEIAERNSSSVGWPVMHSCCTAALLMGFRSSSERSDNGTMEDPALTILHLWDATIDHQFNC